MSRIEKTVFICYRRTNAPWALAIWQDLTHHGFDVFFDYQGIASGDFERVILENIHARAHFLVLLTPSALERCGEPGDWLRREIETALETKRNIVPLMLEGFDFSTPAIANQLTGKLAALKRYNGLDVPVRYFEAAMALLREKFLNVPLEAVPHPAPAPARLAAEAQQAAASAAPVVSQEELTAQQWFEKGFEATDLDEKIRCYSAAIRLKPDYADAYINRGAARDDKGDRDGAIADCNEAIRLKPDDAIPYNNRGNARRAKGDRDGALADYNDAIRLKPDYAEAYNNRGAGRFDKGDRDGALADYNDAIGLKPNFAEAYYNRGYVRDDKGDLDGAIADYTEAIRLKPDFANAYYNRALLHRQQSDSASIKAAMADFQKYLDLGGGIRSGDQAKVEGFISELKKKL